MIWICANEFKKNHTEITRITHGNHTDYTRISHGFYADLIFEIFSHYEEPAEWRGARISPSLRGANEVSDVAIHFYSFTTVPPFIKRPVIISFFGSKFSGFSILLIRASAIARPIVSPFCSYVVSGGIIIEVRAIPS